MRNLEIYAIAHALDGKVTQREYCKIPNCECEGKAIIGQREMSREELIEKVFRELFVPLYPKDKPLPTIIPYEQGMFKMVSSIADALLQAEGDGK